MSDGGGDISLARSILANDLRIFLRAFRRKKMGAAGSVLLQLFIIALLHFVVLTNLHHFRDDPAVAGAPEFGAVLLLMLVGVVALNRCLEIFYNRGDLPMLLASPVPARTVVATRLAAVFLEALIGSAPLALAIIDSAVILFGVHWLWAFPAWIGAVLLVSPIAMNVVLSVVRAIGPRRARTILQVFSILLGVALFVGMQMINGLLRGGGSWAAPGEIAIGLDWFDRAPFNQLVAAASGHAGWLVAMTAAAVPLMLLAFARAGREFIAGAQDSAADAGSGRRASGREREDRAWRGAFLRSPFAVLVRKELRLVLRNPLLLVRCFHQLAILLAVLVASLWNLKLAALAAVGPLSAAVIATILSAMMTIDDEAIEVAGTSPFGRRRMFVARACAAATCAMVAGAIPAIVVAATGEWIAALLSLVSTVIAAAGFGWFGACSTRSVSAEERARAAGQPRISGQVLVAMLLGGLHAAGPGIYIGTGSLVAAMLAAGFAACLTSILFLVPPRDIAMA